MTLESLLAERAVTRTLTRIARAMDARDWSAFDDLVLPDATANMGAGELSGRENIVANIRSFLDECGPTQHLLGNVLVDVDGDTATSQAYVSDMHVGAGDRSHLTFSTLGDYHDEWTRRGDCWQLVRRVKVNRGWVGSFEALGPGPAGWSPKS
ncbi:nuclear transport factor 2 family protein [Rhodococcus spelaei]|uniref:Nuclear transport factor 2 family protein n=1 Tax=Rhodococcus spelaei TaxID=2546320 RepID=A0A541BNM2_9NOCA|nr:nuclear transport factor 2 family protein [Rhodococcus spelaei]TQF73904.1 nuclear transport factor 2 family protein [Rhodococcus spelaei]